jgi:hypothetical protein
MEYAVPTIRNAYKGPFRQRLPRIRFGIAALFIAIVPVASVALVVARWHWRVRAEASAQELLEAAGAVVELAPSATGKAVDRPPNWFLNVIGNPEWRPVWTVYFPPIMNATNEHVALMRSFRDLRSLSVVNSSANDAAFECLRHFPRLESLTIHSHNVNGKCIQRIISPLLRSLDLRGCPINDSNITFLDTSLPITSLDLSNTDVSDVGLAHVLRLQRLHELHATSVATSGEAFREATCEQLSYVDLTNTELCDRTVHLLSRMRFLTVCYLNGTTVTDHSLQQLARCTTLDQLHVRRTCVSNDGVMWLSEVRPDIIVQWDRH